MITWPEQLPILTQGDLVLRPWRDDDVDSVFTICDDSETQYFTTVPTPYTFADAQKWIARQRKGFEDKTDFALAVEINGAVGIQLSAFDSVEFEHIIKIGYATAPEYRGKGYTAQAVKMLVDYLFSLGYRRISADTLPENIGSQKTLLKSGFYLESTQRMAMTNRDGGQTDGLVFAILAPEYR